MRLTVTRINGNQAAGWDGYNIPRSVTLDEKTAKSIREQMCYVRSVTIDLPQERT